MYWGDIGLFIGVILGLFIGVILGLFIGIILGPAHVCRHADDVAQPLRWRWAPRVQTKQTSRHNQRREPQSRVQVF